MPICPECEGKGKFYFPNNSSTAVYEVDAPTVYIIYTCGVCMGSGEISEMALAIYNARGGPAPAQQMSGFS